MILENFLISYQFRSKIEFEFNLNSKARIISYRNDKRALLSRIDFVERNEYRFDYIYDPSGI